MVTIFRYVKGFLLGVSATLTVTFIQAHSSNMAALENKTFALILWIILVAVAMLWLIRLDVFGYHEGVGGFCVYLIVWLLARQYTNWMTLQFTYTGMAVFGGIILAVIVVAEEISRRSKPPKK